MHVSLGPLILFAAVMSLTPGPNVIVVTASAANFGFRRTIPQMVGITAGFGALVMAAGLGLAGLVHAEPRLHLALKYAGGAYLLYLAWRLTRADASGGAPARAKADRLVRGGTVPVHQPEGLGFRPGRAGGLHERGRRQLTGNLGHCRGQCSGLPGVGGNLGRVRRSDRAAHGQSARPCAVHLVDGRIARAFAHAGVLVMAAGRIFFIAR